MSSLTTQDYARRNRLDTRLLDLKDLQGLNSSFLLDLYDLLKRADNEVEIVFKNIQTLREEVLRRMG